MYITGPTHLWIIEGIKEITLVKSVGSLQALQEWLRVPQGAKTQVFHSWRQGGVGDVAAPLTPSPSHFWGGEGLN